MLPQGHLKKQTWPPWKGAMAATETIAVLDVFARKELVRVTVAPVAHGGLEKRAAGAKRHVSSGLRLECLEVWTPRRVITFFALW